MPLPPAHAAALDAMRESLTALQRQNMSVTAFCGAWRTHHAALNALPARYAQVMEDVLGRLESGSLFTEESCSFSQQDLQDTLAIWLDKATQALSNLNVET